jgi:serine phosphatase RsbU (regulator of sigma subunit)
MNSRGKRSQLWVKLAISAGILLGLTLLIETITTYFFVYDKVITEEAFQEAERQEAALLRLAAQSGVRDVHRLGPLVEVLQRDSPRQVAWMRILDFDGHVLAQAGNPLKTAPTIAQLRYQLEAHKPFRREHASSSGRILISLLRFRFNGPPPQPERFGNHPPMPAFAEIAIYRDGVTVPFGDLRRNLTIGCLAALALLASMVLIGILFTRFIQARQLEQQVELARTVQAGLLPTPQTLLSSAAKVDFGAVFVPAAAIGGDFYDIFTNEEGHTSLVLGDVAGKGISAALLMGVLHGAIRSLDWTESGADHEAATIRLNRLLCEKTARERFASLFWANFDPASGLLRYINAGHLPPLLIGAHKMERLAGGGPVLGLLPGAQYRCAETAVEAGDLLVVFSDGIAEAMNAAEEEFGEKRIGDIVREHQEQHPRMICDALVGGIAQFLGPLKPHDDQTLLIVRLTPVAATKEPALESDPATMPA